MEELLSLSTKLHVGAIIILGLLVLFINFRLQKEDDYIKLTKKYEKYSLFYYFFLATLFFTGLILFTVIKFVWSLKIVLMIMAILHMSVTSVKLHIVFKNSRIKDISSQESFKKYAKKKYLIDLIVLVLIGIISYAIHI